MQGRNLVAVTIGGVVPALVLGAIALAGIVRGGSGPASDPGSAPHNLRVELRNWEVAPEHSDLPAGLLAFEAVHPAEDHGDEDQGHGHTENAPGSTHNLVVLRAMPDGTYDSVARTRDLEMGERQTLKVALEPGEYALICDVVDEIGDEVISHTVKGMKTTVTVR